MKNLLQSTRRIVVALLIAYLGLLTLLYFAQGFLIYQARQGNEVELLTHASLERVEPWRDSSGSIIGWWRPNPSARNRVVVFHGNAGYALHRTHFIEALHGLSGDLAWEARVFEYPGYGARPGTPSEKLLIAEAVAALTEIQAGDPRPLYILGESLGSGVASAVAAQLKERIAGVALLVPYESLTHAASFQYPFVPVKWLMRDRYDNAQALRNYGGRVAFLLAEKDEVVTFVGGERLHSGYHGPKFLHVFPETGHNDVDYTPDAPWWRQVSEFLTAPSRVTVGASGSGTN